MAHARIWIGSRRGAAAGALLALLALSPGAGAQEPGRPYAVFTAGSDVLVGMRGVLEAIPTCKLYGRGNDCAKLVGKVEWVQSLGSFATFEEARKAFEANIVPGSQRDVPFTRGRDRQAKLKFDGKTYEIQNALRFPAPDLERAVRRAVRFMGKGRQYAAAPTDVTGEDRGPDAASIDVIRLASLDQPPGAARKLRETLIALLHDPADSDREGARSTEGVYLLLVSPPRLPARSLVNNLEARCGANDRLIRYVRAKDRVKQAQWEEFVGQAEQVRNLLFIGIDVGFALIDLPSPTLLVNYAQWVDKVQSRDPSVKATLNSTTLGIVLDELTSLPVTPALVGQAVTAIRFAFDQRWAQPPRGPQLADALRPEVEGAQTEGAWHDALDLLVRKLSAEILANGVGIAAVSQRMQQIDSKGVIPGIVQPEMGRLRSALERHQRELAEKIPQEISASYFAGWTEQARGGGRCE